MDILSSRILLRPADLVRSRDFYRDVLGLAVHREFGDPERPGTVFFLGNGLLEVSGSSEPFEVPPLSLWLQVRDVRAEYARLREAGTEGLREARLEPWGLWEAWIADPDGVRIVLVQIPDDHPLRRDQRTFRGDSTGSES
ncbi:VOC family protein [Nocardiopsis sp. EMB25]|uniref:VOC family protein n=1 Tax=Nocardiopsis sp. EMB25 TaxID=2835867 RepID=UPI0022847F87|nr:VOC family protein [Nocardiopsis sp. EMB25]MCY9783409.1 VOC family protein [Nocardiopsis sp. EMB25]